MEGNKQQSVGQPDPKKIHNAILFLAMASAVTGASVGELLGFEEAVKAADPGKLRDLIGAA